MLFFYHDCLRINPSRLATAYKLPCSRQVLLFLSLVVASCDGVASYIEEWYIRPKQTWYSLAFLAMFKIK